MCLFLFVEIPLSCRLDILKMDPNITIPVPARMCVIDSKSMHEFVLDIDSVQAAALWTQAHGTTTILTDARRASVVLTNIHTATRIGLPETDA